MKESLMKKRQPAFINIIIGLALAVTLTGCASSPLPSQSGFLEGYYSNMQPVADGGVNKRWLKPGVDFGQYNKVMLDSVVFYFADDSEYKGIDPGQLKALADTCDQAFANALKDKYPIVSEPGPDVVRLRIALTGIRQSRPVLSAVSSVTPPGLVINVVKKGATGTWTGAGATSAELMALDSLTNKVIAAGQDEQAAGFTERFSKYGSAEEAFKFWAGRIRAFLDQAHGSR
jgi:hypothetical protein